MPNTTQSDVSLEHEFSHTADPKLLAEQLGLPEDKVREIIKLAQATLSTDNLTGDDDDLHLADGDNIQIGDFMEDQSSSPIDALLQAETIEQVRKILDESLTPREVKVLRMLFGIGMSNSHTLEEVGRQFDVTGERIRQIKANAIRKLKRRLVPLVRA